MTPALVLEIIKLAMELALTVVKNIPPEQQAKFWERHEKRIEFWEDVFGKMQA